MLSRIFWIGLAGLALLGGIAMQNGHGIISWDDHDGDRSQSIEQKIEARVDRAIDRSFDKMDVVDSDGKEIDVPPETKRALADAVGQLVKAETDLAMLRIRDGSDKDIDEAQARRDQAKANIDRLKDQIEARKELTEDSRDALREQIRAEVRETVRDAVKN
jgi:predicted GTPase